MSDEQTESYILENVAAGYIEFAGIGNDGEFQYRLTPAGEARVRVILGEDEDAP